MQLEESMQSPPFELIDIVVRAGAGAGKTTELTQRVLKLAQDFQKKQQRYPHFVVTTFTRKATQELKERLMKEAMKREDPGLIAFLKRPSQLHISTIHGILSLFLAKFGSMMGLSPKLMIASDSRERQQIKRLIRDLCQKNPEFNLAFQNLLENCEFKDLQDALGAYFRMKMQFGEIPAFSQQDFDSHITAKKKETLETMKALARAIRASEAPEAWQELAGYCEASANQPDFQLVLESLPSPRKSKTVPEDVVDLRDELKDKLAFFDSWRVTADFAEAHTSVCQLFAFCAEAISENLLEAKLFSGEITMQDLETLSLTLIRRHPEAALAFSKQCDYLLVDEYQDTSPVQVELLKALSGESKSFVVGDPQQSIYLFRGARSEVFMQREQTVEQNKGVLFSKLTNYRSKPELLEFFNFFFQKLSPQFQKMKPKAEPTKNPSLPSAELMEIATDKKSDRDVELEAVLYRCQELMKQGVPLEKICVLFRSNKDLEDLAWMAQEFGLAVQAQSAGKFFEQREVLDALALLKFLCNPHDNRNLLQILRSPLFRIKDQSLYEWCQDAGSSYWLTFLKHSHPVITELQSYLAAVQDKGVGGVWREILVQKKYFHFAQTLDPSGKREANLWKLIHMIRSEERKPGFAYLEFLKELDIRVLSTEDSDESEAVPVIEPQRIHLMTVHASKGLQFAHVILPRMGKVPPPVHPDFFLADEQTGKWTISLIDPDEGKKVASLSGIGLMEIMKRRQKEEEDRVLYVALTRAEESVTLIWEENPRSESWAGRLRMDLAPGVHTEAQFAYQVRKGSFVPEKQEIAKLTSVEEIAPFRVALESKGQTLSVTEILESAQAQQKQEAREMADVQKAVTGVDVHRMFESLKYKWMKDPDFDWKSWLPDLPATHQKALQFLADDHQGRWFEIIRGGEVEFGMAVKMGESLLQGQIDLWGRDEQGQTWIVDYKTGSPKYQEKAFQQLEIYLWALRKMKKIKADETVKLAVIYPFSEKTIVRDSIGWNPPA